MKAVLLIIWLIACSLFVAIIFYRKNFGRVATIAVSAAVGAALYLLALR